MKLASSLEPDLGILYIVTSRSFHPDIRHTVMNIVIVNFAFRCEGRAFGEAETCLTLITASSNPFFLGYVTSIKWMMRSHRSLNDCPLAADSWWQLPAILQASVHWRGWYRCRFQYTFDIVPYIVKFSWTWYLITVCTVLVLPICWTIKI